MALPVMATTLAAVTAVPTSDWYAAENITTTYYNNYSSSSATAQQLNVTNPKTDLSLWRYGLGVTVPLICAFGIVGNILSLLVLNNKRKFGAVMFIYVRFMSISDLLAMLICIPESITQGCSVKFNNRSAAIFFANASVPLVNIFFGSSTLIVVLMTAERYLSVCFPLKAKFLSTPIRAHVCVAIVYIVCLIIYAPMVGEFTVQESESGYVIDWHKGYADSFWYREVYTWVRATLIRFIPFIIIILLNFQTIRSYRRIVERRRRMLNRVHQDERHFQEENNLIIILVCTAVVYIVCLSPMPIAHGMLNIKTLKNNQGFQVYLVLGNNLEVLNAALNFYLYCLACREFRNTTREILKTMLVKIRLLRADSIKPEEEELEEPYLTNGRQISQMLPSTTEPPTTLLLINNGSSSGGGANSDRGSRSSAGSLCSARRDSSRSPVAGRVEPSGGAGEEAIPLTYMNQHYADGTKQAGAAGTGVDGSAHDLTSYQAHTDYKQDVKL